VTKAEEDEGPVVRRRNEGDQQGTVRDQSRRR